MPAKKKFLPRPCPICKKKNGTVQIVKFRVSEKAHCRIGHYNSEKYIRRRRKIVSKINSVVSSGSEPVKIIKVRDSSRGKKWCSFTMDIEFVRECIYGFEEDEYDLDMGDPWRRKSLTYSNPVILLDTVKVKGWNQVIYEKYRGGGGIGGYSITRVDDEGNE